MHLAEHPGYKYRPRRRRPPSSTALPLHSTMSHDDTPTNATDFQSDTAFSSFSRYLQASVAGYEVRQLENTSRTADHCFHVDNAAAAVQLPMWTEPAGDANWPTGHGDCWSTEVFMRSTGSRSPREPVSWRTLPSPSKFQPAYASVCNKTL